ncbi:MAG: ATP-binding protein [Nitrospirae bacterium]|nr:ATP-binding protein [Nitrospirota bacterium]
MKTMLMNLSLNAFNAMKDGGTLEIKTLKNDNMAEIIVKDTGEGIQERYLDKIFTPFFSTREGGLGLGLPIVQKIVENHGGRISCHSKTGEGTVFEIIMPLEKDTIV